MFQRVLNYIAGVDRETLATCPPTDRIWAAHLGVSLCLSFVVVFGISFHATGYMISDVRLQAATSIRDRHRGVHVRPGALSVGLVLSGPAPPQ
ncbi:MAG: hypothetical protein MZV49_13865 [Rhodopseudomonas palustris]|nr:hypothetical protein [Rhodopseudomonas palustris]